MKKKPPAIQYGKSYRYTSNEQAIKDLKKIEKRQKAEREKVKDDRRKLSG